MVSRPELISNAPFGSDREPGVTHNAGGPKPNIKKPNTCWFCKKEGHKKKDCYQYKAWLEKKNKKGVRNQAPTK